MPYNNAALPTNAFSSEYVRFVKQAAQIIDYYYGNYDGRINSRESKVLGDYFNLIGDNNFEKLFDALTDRLVARTPDKFFNDGYLTYYTEDGDDEFQQIAELKGETGKNAVFSVSDLNESRFQYAYASYDWFPYSRGGYGWLGAQPKAQPSYVE